jgi:integrase
MASTHKRKDGAIVIRWRCPVTGRNRQFTPDDQRKNWVAELKRSIERSCDEGVVWVPPSERTGEPPDLEDMIADVVRDRRRKLKPRSIDILVMVFGQFTDSIRWKRGLSDEAPLAPSMMSRQALADFYDHQIQVRGNRPRTVVYRIAQVTELWRRLHEHDVHGPHVPRPRRLEDLPAAVFPKMPAPTWEEMDAAIAHAWGWYGPLLMVQRFTGLRLGQVMKLQREDFDLQKGTLRIRGELGKSRSESRGRTVPISPHLVAELEGWGVGTGPLLVVNQPGAKSGPQARGKGWTWRASDKALRHCWERAGVRPEVWKGDDTRRGQPSHACRHGWAWVHHGAAEAGRRPGAGAIPGGPHRRERHHGELHRLRAPGGAAARRRRAGTTAHGGGDEALQPLPRRASVRIWFADGPRPKQEGTFHQPETHVVEYSHRYPTAWREEAS